MTGDLKENDRRCLPVAEWPAKDSRAWEMALADGDLLNDAGPAAHWRQGTRDRVAQSYGRCLGYLEFIGRLDRAAGPADRVARDSVIAYAMQLRQQCASVTVHGYVLNLERALSVMAPDVDWDWLRRLAARLKARARPTRDKRRRVVPAEVLDDLGRRLMDSAIESKNPRLAHQAVRFRDGLMIALLIARPLRLRSFAGLAIGRHLVPADGGYRIVLAPADTKNGRPYEAPVPDWLVHFVDIYLTRFRPILLGERCSDRLWISAGGADMSGPSLYHRLRNVTARELGRPINPHLFRDCATTSLAIDDPAHIHAMQPLLGHSSMRTSEMHYNQAKAIEASRLHQALIVTKRRAIARRANRSK